MLRNYFKVALRSLRRNKLSSFINIFGLALAMTCALMIFLFIKDEVSYDRYNANADRLYRVTRDFKSPDGSTYLHLGHLGPPFGPLMKNDFPDMQEVVRTLQVRFLVAYNEDGTEKKAFNENNAFYAEPEIFKVFTIPLVQGNADKSLRDPFTLMLSEKTSKRYFGNDSPVGKTLRIGNTYDFTVTGVFRDLPAQSHWHPEVLAAFSTLNDSTIYGRRGLENNFGNNSFGTYVLLKDELGDRDAKRIEEQFPAFLDKHMGPLFTGNTGVVPSQTTSLYMQKVTDIHLHSQLDSEVESNGDIRNVYMMGVIAVFIMLIACFNFINLSTARATKRAKEVGLRKVVGAFRIQLISQYLSESILIAMFALALALLFSPLSLQWLNSFTSKSLTLTLAENGTLIAGVVAVAIVVGIIAGVYPAFVVSGFRPAMILKSQSGASRGKSGLRKFLVIAQFTISIVLIIATLITYEQLRFMNNRSLGYNKDQVITMLHFGELGPSYDAFYNEVTSHSAISNMARSSRTPTGRLLDSQGNARIQKGDSMVLSSITIKNVRVDYEFFDTYEIPFASGRDFSKDIPSDDSLAFILNEAAVRMLGVSNEDVLTRDFQYGAVKGRVVGVVKDFHFESLHEPIVPVVFVPLRFPNRISVRIASDKMQEGLQHVEKVWHEFLPHRPFEYTFLSEQYAQLYNAEQKQGELFTIFAGIAIVIGCLGLFGLATFNTLQRVKEIGIRKVLGASVGNIVQLLSREIIILVLVANLIAWPVAWYFMDEWLNTFAYRIGLNVWLYVLAAFAAIAIALITVGTQTLRAAMSNPVDTLRYE